MPKTSIEWVRNDDGSEGYSWPVVNGCLDADPSCANCYAKRLAATRLRHTERYEGLARFGNNGPQWTGAARLVEKELGMPLRLRKPTRIFVCDMGDLFFEAVTDAMLARVFAVMAICDGRPAAPRHTFIVLTKRPERAHAYLTDPATYDRIADAARAMGHLISAPPHGWPLPNVYIGISAGRQRELDERLPWLLRTPAAVRLLSLEPLLEGIRLDRCAPHTIGDDPENVGYVNAFNGLAFHPSTVLVEPESMGTADGVSWVIGGFESGPKARPGHVQWARDLRDQCIAAGAAFFWKQNGEYLGFEAVAKDGEDGVDFTPSVPLSAIGKLQRWHDDGTLRRPSPDVPVKKWFTPGFFSARVGKKRAGRELDGRTWDEFPKSGGA